MWSMRSAGDGYPAATAVFDEPTDRAVDDPPRTIRGDEVLVFDGIFLGRPELASYWDLLVFLDAQERVDLTRLDHVLADAPTEGDELVDPVLRWVERIDRYSSGMRYHLDTADPLAHADVVIDDDDLTRPSIVAGPPFGS